MNATRLELLAQCPLPFGTVPIYQVMAEAQKLEDVSAAAMLQAVRLHAQQGVDFVTVHCGVTRKALGLLKHRVTGVVSCYKDADGLHPTILPTEIIPL